MREVLSDSKLKMEFKFYLRIEELKKQCPPGGPHFSENQPPQLGRHIDQQRGGAINTQGLPPPTCPLSVSSSPPQSYSAR